jgi:hypothetical protein
MIPSVTHPPQTYSTLMADWDFRMQGAGPAVALNRGHASDGWDGVGGGGKARSQVTEIPLYSHSLCRVVTQ